MLTPQWCRIWDLNPYEFDSPEPKSGLSAIPAIRQTACFSCRHKLVLHHLFILAVGWQQTGEFRMTKKISNQVKLDLAAPVRLELTTHGLTVRRSNQLNYRAILIWFLCINIITYFLRKIKFFFLWQQDEFKILPAPLPIGLIPDGRGWRTRTSILRFHNYISYKENCCNRLSLPYIYIITFFY